MKTVHTVRYTTTKEKNHIGDLHKLFEDKAPFTTDFLSFHPVYYLSSLRMYS